MGCKNSTPERSNTKQRPAAASTPPPGATAARRSTISVEDVSGVPKQRGSAVPPQAQGGDGPAPPQPVVAERQSSDLSLMQQYRREVVPGVFISCMPQVGKKNSVTVNVENRTLMRAKLALAFNGPQPATTVFEITSQASKKGITMPTDGRNINVILDPHDTLLLANMALPADEAHKAIEGTCTLVPESDEAKAKLRLDMEGGIHREMEAITSSIARKENGANQSTEDVVAHCRTTRTPFIDLEFAPGMKALAQSFERRQFHDDTVLWFRGRDTGAKLCLPAPNLISACDILPGKLNDAWLMCALAILAEDSQFIARMFAATVPGDDSLGIHTFRSAAHGWFTDVVVDDYLPCDWQKLPMFARCHNNNYTWPSIAEKAFAKLFGSYQSLEFGSTAHALADLTGYPCRKVGLGIEHADAELCGELWLELVEALQDGFIVGIGTTTFGSTVCDSERDSALSQCLDDVTRGNCQEVAALREEYGLRHGYTYSVLQCTERLGHRLLNIRNPWSTGTWQSRCPVPSSDLATSGGSLWLSLNDAVRVFTSLTICHAAPTYRNIRVASHFTPDGVSDIFGCVHVTASTRVYVTLMQRDLRGLNPATVGKEYNPIGFLVLAPNTAPGAYTVLHCTGLEKSRDVSFFVDLEPSEHPYLVVPITGSPSSVGSFDTTLSLHYSTHDCGALELRQCSRDLVAKCALLAALREGEEHVVRHDEGPNARPLLRLIVLRSFRWLVCVVVNDCPTRRAFIEKLDFSNSEGYELCEAYGCRESPDVGLCFEGLEVPPESSRLAFTLCADADRWAYDYSLQSRLSRKSSSSEEASGPVGMVPMIDHNRYERVECGLQAQRKDSVGSMVTL